MTEVDEKILQLINGKDTLEQGFKLLMDTYQKRLYHYIRSIVNSHEDTDDILQNTFLKAFKSLNKFEKRSGLYSWLYRIASNETYSFLKKKNKHTVVLDAKNKELSALAGDQGTYLEGEAIKNMLIKAMKGLPPKQKMVFSLRYFEEKSYKEISRILGTSVGALKASYFHAIKKIEDYLKTYTI